MFIESNCKCCQYIVEEWAGKMDKYKDWKVQKLTYLNSETPKSKMPFVACVVCDGDLVELFLRNNA